MGASKSNSNRRHIIDDTPTVVDNSISNSVNDNDKNDWKLKIEPHGFGTNGLITIKLEGLHSTFERYIYHIAFDLKYKYHDDVKWKSTIFYGRMTTAIPSRHINIRVDTNLYDYNMMFSLSMLISKKISRHIPRKIDNKNVFTNKWFTDSNIINVNIPSLMRELEKFKLNDLVKFRTTEYKQNQWTYGQIVEINDDTYTVLNHDGNTFKVADDDDDDDVNMKPRFIHNYIDLSERCDADNSLLIGNRNDVGSAEIYAVLYDVFLNDYCPDMHKRYWNKTDFISAAKCIAINVVNCLSVNIDKGYKIKCVFDDNHYNNTLKLISNREYAVGRSIDLCDPDDSQGIVYFCDICRCRQGSYDWTYRCQLKKEHRYNGHDICITCVYDMIKKYNQLAALLADLLQGDLTSDCIQSIVILIVGNVVKL